MRYMFLREQPKFCETELKLYRILETPKRVLWQTVKTKMKCSISSGSTLFAMIKKNLQGPKYIIHLKILPVTPKSTEGIVPYLFINMYGKIHQNTKGQH